MTSIGSSQLERWKYLEASADACVSNVSVPDVCILYSKIWKYSPRENFFSGQPIVVHVVDYGEEGVEWQGTGHRRVGESTQGQVRSSPVFCFVVVWWIESFKVEKRNDNFFSLLMNKICRGSVIY